jgi:hypothetical protein
LAGTTNQDLTAERRELALIFKAQPPGSSALQARCPPWASGSTVIAFMNSLGSD